MLQSNVGGVCTVVTRWDTGSPVHILAIRDEHVSRDFDDPGEWWPDQPGVIGGRDRLAGGSWCVSDAASGVTALLLNRIERHNGTPSRGVLPLRAVAAGSAWTDQFDHREMASFTLVLAGPSGVAAWTWDASELRRDDLGPGTHMITSRGIDAADEKTARYAQRFRSQDWLDIVTSCPPVDDRTALIVSHQFETDTFATVLGQLITSAPGSLVLSYSRTPWLRDTWTNPSQPPGRSPR